MLLKRGLDFMVTILEGIFKVAFSIWNAMIGLACDMFSVSYKDASTAGLYSTAHGIFNTIAACTVPLASLFFIIAIYKTVASTPPEQQAKKFMLDALKYVIFLYLSSQLWNIMGHIMDFTAELTSAISSAGGSTPVIDINNNVVLQEVRKFTFSLGSHGLNIGAYIEAAVENLVKLIVFFIGGIASIFILGAAGLSVIGVAFERIIKPLVILPFSAIVLGIGACSGEGERMMWHYGKSFLALCLSGAFMITAVHLGNALLTTFSIANKITSPVADGAVDAVVSIVQLDMGAIVITGLLKSMDSVISKVFG